MERFVWEIRRLSTETQFMGAAVAHRVGLNASDLKCAELLVRNGPMTAGQLAELSNLTTGAITGVVDRLEKAGWARREPSPTDRRSVVIRALPRESKADEGLYDSWGAAMIDLLAGYSDAELELILNFMDRLSTSTHKSAVEIREMSD